MFAFLSIYFYFGFYIELQYHWHVILQGVDLFTLLISSEDVFFISNVFSNTLFIWYGLFVSH